MSGIVGLCQHGDTSSCDTQLNNMATRLQHRAGRGVDINVSGSFGIGRLKSDLNRNAEIVELHSLTGYLDGRLDNRADLLHQLEISDSSASDSSLLIHAYKKWDTNCAQHLIGDFICVVWDALKQELFCARDHMGVRPLYYYQDNTQFAFASESAAFTSLSGAHLTINNTRIADYLLGYEYADFDSTFYTEVKRLPPAHYLVFNRQKLSIHRYWSLNELTPLELSSDEEYQQAFKEVLHQAVACRLDPARDTASLLSGGIDSAAVTVSALNQSDRVSIHSAVSDKDADTRYIRKFGVHLKCKIVESKVDSLVEREREISKAMQALDEPFPSSGSMLMALYIGARQAGQRIVLDGLEGDQIVSLPSDYSVMLLRQLKFRIALQEKSRQAGIHNENQLLAMLLAIRAALIPHPLRVQIRKLRFPKILANSIDEWPTDPKQIDRALKTRYFDLYKPDPLTFNNPLSLKLSVLNMPYIAVAMERYDKIAAVCGVEARHPLLDKRVVEFCCRLPWNQQVRNGWSKWILRKSIDTELPEGLAWRIDRPHLGPEFTAAWSRAHQSNYHRIPRKLPRLLDSSRVESILTDTSDNPSDQESQWLLHSLISWIDENSSLI